MKIKTNIPNWEKQTTNLRQAVLWSVRTNIKRRGNENDSTKLDIHSTKAKLTYTIVCGILLWEL